MANRKIIRNGMRRKAERLGVKPSKYVNRKFEQHQIAKYGEEIREINKAKGTKKRRTWKLRIASALDALESRKIRKRKRG